MNDDARPELTRVTVNLMPRAAEAMRLAARREELSQTDTINRALQVYDFLSARNAAGFRFLLTNPDDGAITEVEFL
jgi:hypothetical protein